MPSTCQIDAKNKLVLATPNGTLTRTDLQSYARMVLDDSGVRTGFDELLDLSGIERVDITESEVADALGLLTRFELQRQRTKTAIVSSDRNLDAIARLVELLRPRLPSTLQVFGDIDAARAWLRAPAEVSGRSASERRAAPRKPLNLAALINGSARSRSGRLVNISVSGALLRCDEPLPGVDTSVGIHLEPDLTPRIDISGRTVRLIDDGFAMQFNRVTAELLQLVGDPF
jgi:hypothetical protein